MEYVLPQGIVIDAIRDVEHMSVHSPETAEEHKRQNCRLCHRSFGVLLTYDDLLPHWHLLGLELEPCSVCGREYPAVEYITCGFAAICRHCQVSHPS